LFFAFIVNSRIICNFDKILTKKQTVKTKDYDKIPNQKYYHLVVCRKNISRFAALPMRRAVAEKKVKLSRKLIKLSARSFGIKFFVFNNLISGLHIQNLKDWNVG